MCVCGGGGGGGGGRRTCECLIAHTVNSLHIRVLHIPLHGMATSSSNTTELILNKNHRSKGHNIHTNTETPTGPKRVRTASLLTCSVQVVPLPKGSPEINTITCS